MIHFWLCLEDGYENFEQLRLNFSKLSLPPATIKRSKQSQWIQSYVGFSKQTLHSYVWVSIDSKTYFSILKWGKMAWQSPFIVLYHEANTSLEIHKSKQNNSPFLICCVIYFFMHLWILTQLFFIFNLFRDLRKLITSLIWQLVSCMCIYHII